jgi:uncharacterized membrane protein YjjP (DUF1212 family)
MTLAVSKSQQLGRDMTRKERSNLVLSCARVLYVNGESTQKTLDVAEHLGNCLGFRTTILLRWGALELQAEDADGRLISAIGADPSGVNIQRVVSTLHTVEEVCNGKLSPAYALEVINKVKNAPPAPGWLFTLAAVGALALAVLFGVQHLQP